MACACGSKASKNVAYRVLYVDADGEGGEAFAEDMGGYRMIRTSVEQAGGTVTTAVQVPRAQYDTWAAQQQT